jgi:hypothetical protein
MEGKIIEGFQKYFSDFSGNQPIVQLYSANARK